MFFCTRRGLAAVRAAPVFHGSSWDSGPPQGQTMNELLQSYIYVYKKKSV